MLFSDFLSFINCFSLFLAFQAAPWAPAITDKIQGMGARIAAVEQMETRAVVAEDELNKVRNQNEVLSGQADVLLADKQKLEEDLDKARKKILERNNQLKLARKQSHMDKKILLQDADRSFQFGFYEAVTREHGLGFDHKLLPDEGMDDPVGRETADEVPVVSSGSDKDLSK